jgi:hypothetical protein
MKKIISTVGLGSLLFVSGTLFTLASYYTPYYNTYQNAPTSNSYVYVQGCYTYQYDAYTHITSLLGSTCTTTYPAYNNSYYNNYSYSYPVTTAYSYQNTYTQNYSYPVSTSYPVTTSYMPASPYYTYGYYEGNWYPGYQNTTFTDLFNSNSYGNSYNNYSNYGGYNNNYNYMNNGCYYQNGYQVCY